MDVEVVGRVLSTLPQDDDHPYRTGAWRPQTTEWRADDLEVVGARSPPTSTGVYLRNTENPVHPALERYHPFDGDGMVHVVGFRRRQGLLPQPLRPHRRARSPSRRRASRSGPASPSARDVARATGRLGRAAAA